MGDQAFSGSTRTFSALLKSMLAKNKMGLVVGITRRNSAPAFFAMLPQVRHLQGVWLVRIHLCFRQKGSVRTGRSSIRQEYTYYLSPWRTTYAPRRWNAHSEVCTSYLLVLIRLDIPLTAGEPLIEAAAALIGKLTLKNGRYEPDSYPNPGTCVRMVSCDGVLR